MQQDERDFIRQSARRVEEWENTPRPFEDPYAEMTSEDKSKALLAKDEVIGERNRQIAELMARLDKVTASLEESNRNMAQVTVTLNGVIDGLRQQLDEANRSNRDLMKELAALKEQKALADKERFGSKSQKGTSKAKAVPERSRRQDKDDFDGTPGSIAHSGDAKPLEKPAPKGRTQAQLTADMRRRGSTYRRMEATEKVVHATDLSRLPAGAQVVKVVRKFFYDEKTVITEHEYEEVVYRLGDTLVTAYLPAEGEPEVIDRVPGTHASADMLAHLAFNRFVLDTPLYREVGRLEDEGMRLSRKTLTNWLHKGSLHLAPMVEELKRIALERDSIVNCDETWCRVKVYDRYRKRYIWCLVNKEERIVIFCYEDGSRGRDALKAILDDAPIKALQSDGYNVYLYLDDEVCGIDHIGCMAHARAKFRSAQEACGDADSRYILDCIGELYGLEKAYRKAGLTPEQVGQARRSTVTMEVVGRLRSKLDVLMAPDHPPLGELMEKAVRYLDTFWKQIFRYTEDGRYSIDNNIAERQIRPLAGERKNSLFFGSHRMAVASATYHTVAATCRMMGLSALEYLKAFFRKITEGVRDYPLLMPQTIGISAKQC